MITQTMDEVVRHAKETHARYLLGQVVSTRIAQCPGGSVNQFWFNSDTGGGRTTIDFRDFYVMYSNITSSNTSNHVAFYTKP